MPLTSEEIQALLAKEIPVHNPWVDKFDQAAVFLLDLNCDNLYDFTTRDFWFKCKGCKALVKRNEREAHHRQHRKDFGL